MYYLSRIGLVILFGFWSQVFIIANPQVISPDIASATQRANDPERLFVEAMKIAETEDRTNAGKHLDEACLLWIKRGERERAARARLQIGDLYRSNKRFDESLSQYRQTLLIDGLSASLRALTYDAIGQIYAELYQTELSLRNYTKALHLARQDKDYAVQAQVQLNLASLTYKRGEFTRALELAQSAVVSSSRVNDEKAVALSLGFLGQLELKSGRLDQGQKDLDRAMALYRQHNDLPAQIKTLCFLSGLNLSARRVSLAQEQAQSALRIAEDLAQRATTNSQRLRANALRWPSWLALARAQKASQQHEDALKSYFRAVSGTVVDWWMVYSSTERSAIGFAEERQAPYRELVDLLVALGRINEAYDAYQYARIRTLSGFISARRLATFRNDRDTDDKITALSASIIVLRTRLLSPTLTRPQRENLQRQLVEVEDDLAERRLQTELNHSSRRFIFSRPARLKQLQTKVLGDGESVIEFCLGEDRSFVWLITRDTLSFEILPGRAEIEGKVMQYVRDLSTAPANLHLQSRVAKQQQLGAEVFKMLFGKLGSQLRPDSKLIVVPDGLLNLVPYESLVHAGHYLIEDHQISYLPSTSLIELLRQPRPRLTSDREVQLDLLAFGDPVFASRSKSSTKLPTIPLESDTQVWDWDMARLLRLPRSRDEVEYIASLIPNDRKHLYLGSESTEKAFKQEPLHKFRWIHLATHSLIDERNPGRSAVVLGLDAANDEDGFLRATEITDLELNCDLVILSACETGRGQLSSGEGIIGLSRAFFIAGARAVLVSQWAVSDISTAQLMKDFYQQLVKDAATPAALREAKLSMLQGGSETRHPYYWAPFVIIGAP